MGATREEKMDKLAVVILAAGEGTRMKSAYAKVAHDLAGKPLILHVLATARALDPGKIIVIVGHDADGVRRIVGDGAEFATQAKQLGTGHAVMQARPLLGDFDGTILVLSGDVPLIEAGSLRKLLDAHVKGDAACTLLTAIFRNPTGYGRVLRKTSGKIYGIVEEKDASRFEKAIEEVNAGVYCFSAPKLFAALEKLSPDNRQGELYLTDVVGILSHEGNQIEAVEVEDACEILGVNSRLDLARIERLFQGRILKRHMLNGVTIKCPASTYIEESVSMGSDTVIYPFTVIRGDVSIGRNCVVGPFVNLRGPARIPDNSAVTGALRPKTTPKK